MFGTLDNAPINKNKPIGTAIIMPKAALAVLSLMDPIKTNIDISARHHHVSVFSANCISLSFFVQSRPQCSRIRLPKFHSGIILHQPKTG